MLLMSQGLGELDREIDKNNPTSFYSLISPSVQERIGNLPENVLSMSEHELKKYVTAVDTQVRLSLWHEYYKCQMQNRKISIMNALAGICSKQYFYKLIDNQHKLAYLTLPPPKYKFQVEEMLGTAMDKLREVLEVPLYKQDGEFDVGAGSLILKAASKLYEIVHGSVVQRNLNVNMETDVKTLPQEATVEELDKKLLELRKKAHGQMPSEIAVSWTEVE